MDQASIAERVEQLVRELHQIAPEQRQDQAYTDRVEALLEALFEEDGLRTLGHLLTLDVLEDLLRENRFDQGYPEEFRQLQDHRQTMAQAHAKLAAILNPQVSIQDLLYVTLDDWPQRDEPVGLAFPPDFALELQALRFGEGRPSEHLSNFLARYFGMLVESGAEAALTSIKGPLDTALAAYTIEEQQATVHALFAERTGHQGYCYRVKISVDVGPGNIYTSNEANGEMKQAASTAAQYALSLSGMLIQHYDVRWSINEPLSYEGRSIGLAIALGVLAEFYAQPIDGYTAFTGTVADDGHVGRIDFLAEKLAAAQKAGFQRVLVPKENWEGLHPPAAALPPATTLQGLVRHFTYECKRAGIQVREERRPECLRLWATDYAAKIPVDIYTGKGGIKFKIGGSPHAALVGRVKPIVETIFGTGSTAPSQPKFRKFVVDDPALRTRIAAALRAVAPCEERTEASCAYRLDFFERGERVIVRQYTNGTLTIQQVALSAVGDPLFTNLCRQVELITGATLPVGPIASVHAGSERPPRTENPLRSDTLTGVAYPFKAPWIGTDESGKGDYFGPLVSAAVYVDDQLLEKLAALGVKDSKLLSDKKAHELAQDIRDICKGRFAEKVMTPDEYNRHYSVFQSEGKTLNSLLAWAHYRVVEDLLAVVDCENIIVDQFAYEYHLRSRLFAKNPQRKLNLIQIPRAEANLAVAAASILARDRFLTWIEKLSLKYGALPKGASAAVVQTARAIVARYGKEELRMIAKLHFKTTEQVLAPD
jgi:ribonuclease HIII